MAGRGPFLAMFLTGAVTIAGSVFLVTRPRTAPLPTTTNPEFTAVIPPFSLTERGGKTVTNADLLGKVWVASFVFTRCSGPCPAVTATVARLQAEFKNEPDVRLVTFTVDPERDDVKELKAYAERFSADPEKWLFLTGPEPAIQSLMQDGFKLGRVKKAGAAPGDEFDHSTRLVVVDGEGVARGYFDGMAPEKGRGDPAAFDAGIRRLIATVKDLR